jgi:hypothetical protein
MPGRSFEIDFVGHACLKVTHGDTKLLTDPWIDGPAYTEQWYHYPLPDRSLPLDDVQYIQYTHGHEDHLHEPSFHLLSKQATVLLTKQWFAGNREWLLGQGFERVVELTSGRWMDLGEDLSMVSLVNRSDSLAVLRTSDEILVNVNDALHCYSDDCIDFYCRRIQSLVEDRPIDYVFCGFGGASYFPNCLRHAEKDDHAVAKAREEHFAKGFARVVRNLRPRMAFAFAAGLVLLEPYNHWINQIKFANDPVTATTELLPEMEGRVVKLRPGDRIADGEFTPGASAAPEDPVADYRALYEDEVGAKLARSPLEPERADDVLRTIEANFRERLRRIRTNTPDFDWAVRLRDHPDAILRLSRTDGELTAARLSPDRLAEVRDMVIESNSDVLLAGVGSLWGGDSLQIGYGGIFELRSEASVDENHSRHFLKLATRLPLQSDYLLMSPIRGISHLMHSPYLARQAAQMLLRRSNRPIADSAGRGDVMEARYWIEAPPCEGCPVCDVTPDEDITRDDLASHVDGPYSS